MILTIDIGNSHTVLGIFQKKMLINNWRIRTKRERTSDELGVLIHQLFMNSFITIKTIKGVMISSVVPNLNNAINGFCQRYLNITPLFVSPEINIGMPIYYNNPYEIGADRIVNAIAAYEQFRQDLIIIDFGTAITFDCISARGEYLGGAISPGVVISCEALFQHTSKLPRVELFNKPTSIVAKDTMNSMRAGILYGYAGLVDGIVTTINDERKVKCKVIATGGIARIIAEYSHSIEVVDDFLTLHGLFILYQRNQ